MEAKEQHGCGSFCSTSQNAGITRKEKYVEILKQHLKILARKLMLGQKLVFETMTTSIPPKCKMAYRQKKQAIAIPALRKCVGIREKACMSKEA